MSGRGALRMRVGAFSVLLAGLPACGSERDPAFELGSGEYPWSHLTLSVSSDLEPQDEPPPVPPSTWRRDLTVSDCQLSGLIYGVGWPMPCEGSAAGRVEDCAPDPEVAGAQRCRVTLDTLTLTLRPDWDDPVIDAATVALDSPATTDELWMGGTLTGPVTEPTGTLTVAGRDGGGPTRYELASLDLTLDYVWSSFFLVIDAAKPGW